MGTYLLPKEASRWTIHEIKIWCRKKLCGAPPANPIDTQSGIELKWPEVKRYAGNRLSLRSNFSGLIINNVFEMADTAPLTGGKKARSSPTDSILQNIANPDKINALEEANELFWKGVKELVDWYNRDNMQGRHDVGMMWRVGKEMLDIKQEVNEKMGYEYVTESNLRYSIEEWGIGHEKRGYTNQQVSHCLETYKWLQEDHGNHPIMKHRTNPIMKLIQMESKDRERRMNLFMAYHSGPLKGLTDDQFGWALRQSPSTYPNLEKWDKILEYNQKIATGLNLSDTEISEFRNLLTLSE